MAHYDEIRKLLCEGMSAREIESEFGRDNLVLTLDGMIDDGDLNEATIALRAAKDRGYPNLTQRAEKRLTRERMRLPSPTKT